MSDRSKAVKKAHATRKANNALAKKRQAIKLDLLAKHPLATQPLKALLKSLGLPQTSSEKKTVTLLANAHAEMEEQFPSPELEDDLNDLYSKAQATVDAVQHGLLALATEFSNLDVEVMGLTTLTSTATGQEKLAAARSKTFHQIERDCTPVLERARELVFFALEAATKRIYGALKQVTQK